MNFKVVKKLKIPKAIFSYKENKLSFYYDSFNHENEGLIMYLDLYCLKLYSNLVSLRFNIIPSIFSDKLQSVYFDKSFYKFNVKSCFRLF